MFYRKRKESLQLKSSGNKKIILSKYRVIASILNNLKISYEIAIIIEK
jgi:hypothetical protein